MASPPDPNAPRTKAKPKQAKRTSAAPDFSEVWTAIPGPARALGIAAVVVLLGYFIWPAIRPRKGPEAVELPERVTVAGKAFVDEDKYALEKWAKPGTVEDLDKWFDQMRPKLWVGRDKISGAATTVDPTRVVATSEGGNVATIDVVLYMPPDVPPPPDAKAGQSPPFTFTLPMVWALSEKKIWQIDGTASLQRANEPPKK